MGYGALEILRPSCRSRASSDEWPTRNSSQALDRGLVRADRGFPLMRDCL